MSLLSVDKSAFCEAFNVLPLALSHALHEHPALALDNVRRLVDGWPGTDFFVASGASAPGTRFYATPAVSLTPAAAFDQLDRGSYRILLKRLEQHDTAFRDLLATLLEEVMELRPELRNEKILRLESFMFISSAVTITPFHFDPEIGFFFQILGNKRYHMYSPRELDEDELEDYYLRGAIDIGQVDFARCSDRREFLFDLGPGLGMHQPVNAPHWVETSGTLSISYSFAIETERTRALGRTRAFNGLCRRMALSPAAPGRQPVADLVKANCMHVARPLMTGARTLGRLMR